MMELACRNQERRVAVRKSQKLCGLDYLEVSEDHKTLKAYFLGKVPSAPLRAENFRVEGGRRIRDIKVLAIFPKTFDDPELDDYVEVLLDKFGDFSPYTLRVVARVRDGHGQRWEPHPEFDPQYDHLEFSFTVDCKNDLDCCQPSVCGVTETEPTAINYLAKDYRSFRQLIFDRLAVVMPDWTDRYVPDVGVTLVELLAYAGDYLSYYQDAVATEAYLDTARQRISVRRHARLVDYVMHEGCNARALMVVTVSGELLVEPEKVQFVTPADINLPVELTVDALRSFDPNTYQVFEPVLPTQLYAGQEQISIYTWGDSECCLVKGATRATLVDGFVEGNDGQARKLRLKAGDILIFEEVIGAKTGVAADRDPAHRWPVRLTSVTADADPLTGALLVEVEWGAEDALPFSFCLSSIGPPPECRLLTDVTIARGNVVLVDHGRWTSEDLPPIPIEESEPHCDCAGVAAEVQRTIGRYRPKLQQPNVTFRQRLKPDAAVARLLNQDAKKADPVVMLTPGVWQPSRDLIEADASTQAFVVEVDNDRLAHLRFGDGRNGALPPATGVIRARYRVGNGKTGNVGAEAITHVLWPSNVSGLITNVRNPLAARGGIDWQPLPEVKLFAPHQFKTRLERAVTADDYAAIAQREFPEEIQRAAAALRWNGSWYEVLVAIDVFGSDQATPELIRRIWRRLNRYRRVGHDLRVQPAIRVPLLIKLGICVKAVYLRAHVLADLKAVFSTGIFPNGSRGFFHPDNLTFGSGLYLSQVVSTAQSIAGVESVTVLQFERMFDGAHGEVDAGLIAFGPFEIPQCDNDLSFPENGQIGFVLGGGR